MTELASMRFEPQTDLWSWPKFKITWDHFKQLVLEKILSADSVDIVQDKASLALVFVFASFEVDFLI